VLNVVATIEIPTSHQGADRPEVKNSLVLELARRQKNSAGRNEIQMLATMMTQSIDANGNPVIEPPEKLSERRSR
jgi:hypothetical protein